MKIGVQIAKEYADDADAFSKKIYDVIGSGVGIIESVPAAISIAYYTRDPNECCLMCANLGGIYRILQDQSGIHGTFKSTESGDGFRGIYQYS